MALNMPTGITTPSNQPPTTPPSITVPTVIRLGVAFTVSWTASTDPDGHAITYYLDRQKNGGAWTNISNTTALQFTQTLGTESDTTSVAYRVRAKDSQGLFSDYRTSETRTVLPQHQPPTTPPSITVPANATASTNFTVSWGASTNPQGGTITYYLERQASGGSWASVTSTTSKSVSTSIPNTGTYYHRVRAKNTAGQYSDWKTSTGTYITAQNQPPTTPPSITVPQTALPGQTITIEWGASTDPDGDSIHYELKRVATKQDATQQTDTVYIGSTLKHIDTTVPQTAIAVTYKVTAIDSHFAVSGGKVSNAVIILHESPPTITGQDKHLGAFGDSVSYVYTVYDNDDDTAEVVEAVNGHTFHAYTATTGVQQHLLLDGNSFTALGNGRNEITITATDDSGLSDTRTLTFDKEAVSLSAKAREAIPSDTRPTRINVVLTGAFPSGSWMQVLVTNNGLDDAPEWEDATQATVSRLAYVFQNKRKTASKWGVNAKVIVHRGGQLAD